MVRTKHRPLRVGTSAKVPRKQLANKLHRKTIGTVAGEITKKKRRYRPVCIILHHDIYLNIQLILLS